MYRHQEVRCQPLALRLVITQVHRVMTSAANTQRKPLTNLDEAPSTPAKRGSQGARGMNERAVMCQGRVKRCEGRLSLCRASACSIWRNACSIPSNQGEARRLLTQHRLPCGGV